MSMMKPNAYDINLADIKVQVSCLLTLEQKKKLRDWLVMDIEKSEKLTVPYDPSGAMERYENYEGSAG